jgi:hypothetical protein
MKKILYLIITLNFFVTLKAGTEEPKETQSLGEFSCTIGTAVIAYNAGCTIAGYIYPNINLGLRYTESIFIFGPRALQNLLGVFTIYPFKGSFYIDMELGGYYHSSYKKSYYAGNRMHDSYSSAGGGSAFGFHMGNRWVIFENLFLGINYLGVTYPTDVVLIGFELGYRF